MPDHSDVNLSPGDGADDHDPAFGDLVARYLDRLNDGACLDAGEILQEQPLYGQAILEELETFMDLGSEHGERWNQPLGTLGDYTLRREVGRGGMGVVYEAWQGSVERQVALKVLPAGIAADERALQRFVREAKTAAQLGHQNIVSVHGMGVESNTPYYSMEYVEGETLAQILGRLKETQSDAEASAENPFGATREDETYYANLARAFAGVAEGLQHAHSRGVVHRDIKPSNLIL